MRIVASLTTMPDRINLIKPVLDSVLNQTVKVSHIEINVPYKCVRTKQDYVVPEWLKTYPSLTIVRTEDYGAITKIAPTLLRYKDDKETYLWSVDDDIRYPPYMLEVLVKYHDPSIKRILAHATARIDRTGLHGCPVVAGNCMMLQGFGTVLYPPESIDDYFENYVIETSAIPDCRCSDDLVLSNYFFSKSIDIFCCPADPEKISNNTRADRTINAINLVACLLSYNQDQYATSLQSGGHHERYMRVIQHLKNLGLLAWADVFPVRTTRYERLVSPLHMPRNIKNFAITGSSQLSGKRFWG